MITETAKVYVALVVLAPAAASAYALFSGDHALVFLFVSLGVVGLVGAVALAAARDPGGLPEAPPEQPAAVPVAIPALPGGGAWPLLAAAAVALLVAAPLAGALVGGAGAALGLAAAGGWTLRTGADRTGRTPHLMPLGIPVVGMAAIAALMFLVSRILLAVPEAASTAIAIVAAVLIMIGAIVIVRRPAMSSRAVVATLAVAALVMTGGGLVAAKVGQRDIEVHGSEASGEHGEGAAPGEAAGGGAGQAGEGESAVTVEITAQDVAFDTDEIDLPAESEVTVVLDNRDDGVSHNLAIYAEDGGGDPVFQGEVFAGPGQREYTFTTPAAGVYTFRCDVHPTQMTGTARIT